MAISSYLVFGLLCIGYADMSALSNDVLRLAKIMHLSCASESAVNEELIKAANYGDFAEDQNLKCYMKCQLEALNVMGEDGEIDTDLILDLIVPPQYAPFVEPIFRKCHGIKGVDNCDTAFQTNKCWQAAGPTFYLLV